MTDQERQADLGRRVEAMKMSERLERQWPDGRWRFVHVHNERWGSDGSCFGKTALDAMEEADRKQAEGERARAETRANYERYRCKATLAGLRCEDDADHMIEPEHYAHDAGDALIKWKD